MNDGSKDDSLRKLKEMAVIGKYAQLVNSDDCLEKAMISTLVDEIKNSNSDIEICGYHTNDNRIICSIPQALYTKEELLKKFYSTYSKFSLIHRGINYIKYVVAGGDA